MILAVLPLLPDCPALLSHCKSSYTDPPWPCLALGWPCQGCSSYEIDPLALMPALAVAEVLALAYSPPPWFPHGFGASAVRFPAAPPPDGGCNKAARGLE